VSGVFPRMELREHAEKIVKDDWESFVLGVDIGGTHTNLGVAGVKGERTFLLFSTHFESQKLDSLIPAVKNTLEYARENYGIELEKGCAGAAGPVKGCAKAKLTNVSWSVDSEEIKRECGLEEFYLVNDFQLIGYGIESLRDEDLYLVKKGDPGLGENRAIIGAGTGLGKSMLVYYEAKYWPISCEGGHADFPVQNQLDLDLAEHIRGGRKTPTSYEDVLSGRGIVRIYNFLKEKYGVGERNEVIEKAEDRAASISMNKDEDRIARKTFELYAKYYGRCAKNYVLDTLATGGLYIAGGIAPKNLEIFVSENFQNEFLKAEKQRQILERTPIYAIVNYDVSLYGACNAALVQACFV